MSAAGLRSPTPEARLGSSASDCSFCSGSGGGACPQIILAISCCSNLNATPESTAAAGVGSFPKVTSDKKRSSRNQDRPEQTGGVSPLHHSLERALIQVWRRAARRGRDGADVLGRADRTLVDEQRRRRIAVLVKRSLVRGGLLLPLE